MAEPLRLEPDTVPDEHSTIYTRLMRARAQLHAKIEQGTIKPTGWNPYSEYAYWQLSDIVKPINDTFRQNGLGLTPMTSDGVMAMLQVVDLVGESVIDVRIPMSTARLTASHEVQNLGAVWSYNRRYLLLTVADFPEADILDSGAAGDPKPKENDPATEIQMDYLVELIGDIPDEAQRSKMIDALQAELAKGGLTIRKASAWIDRVKVIKADYKAAQEGV